MSKSRGNIVDPWDHFNREGADATRWYMVTAGAPWSPLKFDSNGVRETYAKMFLTLWNIYKFHADYAALDGFDPETNTMVKLIKEGHNIAISRTFSKIYGMAGQRVGYIIAHPEIIRTINRNGTGEYSTAMAGVSGAIACYDDEEFLNYSKSKINEAKEMVIEVASSNGLETLPSQTNFISFT